MKKVVVLLCALVLCLSLSAPALAAGTGVTGYVLYSDIVATVNGHPIRSWNIGGYTAVMAEDLLRYGFSVVWDGQARTLRISQAGETPQVWPDYQPEALTHPVGSRAMPVYATDIVTYMSGERVESFNVGGWTLVWMDDLARYGDLVWYPQEREIALTLDGTAQGNDWWVNVTGESAGALGDALTLRLRCSGTEVTVTEAVLPGANMTVTAGASGVTIMHNASLLEDEDFTATGYYTAFAALRPAFPSVMTDADMTNSPAQREEAAKYFRFTVNGEPVSGDLWWSQGNNHLDLNFTFSVPVPAEEGDELLLTVGAAS